MSSFQIVEARTPEHFAALSRIHALAWHSAYAGVIPQSYLDREITLDRWIPFFQLGAQKGTHQGLLLLRDGAPVCSGSFGPARLEGGPAAGGCSPYLGWGEIISLYTLPGKTGKGYGSRLLEEMVRRLEQAGCPGCLLYVLRENPQARRFYERCGFCWDGTQVEVPLPPETVCTDLRYVRHFDEGRAPRTRETC